MYATPTRPSAPAVALTLRAAALAVCALLLQACGGGGSGGGTTPPPLSVDRLSYGRLSTFTVTGTDLTNTPEFTSSGCDNVAVLAGGTSTRQTFTCTPNEALSVHAAASAAGKEIYNSTFTVPKPQVTLTTTTGAIVVELEPAIVKVTVNNFLAYVKSGFYDGTIFHRVVQGFVSQGGGFTGVASGTLIPQVGIVGPIVLESNMGLSNLRGTIAMARTDVFDSATSQFFFNQVDNNATGVNNLDFISVGLPGYAVFGHIVSGLTVIDAMNTVTTQTVGAFTNVPIIDIVLQSAVQSQ